MAKSRKTLDDLSCLSSALFYWLPQARLVSFLHPDAEGMAIGPKGLGTGLLSGNPAMAMPTTRTTRKPVANVLDVVPELANRAMTAIRLHPRRGEVPGPADSKIGGTFLWPAEEPWPTCKDTCPYAEHPESSTPFPVLQLNARDFPEIEFFPGTDLLQVLWCVYSHDAPIFAAKPFCYWRNSHDLKAQAVKQMPLPMNEEDVRRLPKPCVLLPERITEFPPLEGVVLRREEYEKLSSCGLKVGRGADDQHDFARHYELELSASPCNKVGGYPCWIQSDETPICDGGHRMALLLQLSDGDCTGPRWLPEEDGSWEDYRTLSGEERELINDAPHFTGPIFDGRQFIFVCRSCKDWPIKAVFQS